IYAKLFGLSKKIVDYAIKADIRTELSNILKKFINRVQSKVNSNKAQDENGNNNIGNPNISRNLDILENCINDGDDIK
ncbi:729_t:CDS:2, partial [Racocetra fulgida]